MTTASISLLNPDSGLPRSSHSIEWIGDSVYLLGGEIQPREPASPFLNILQLNSTPSIKYQLTQDKSVKAFRNEPSPSIRVGAASVTVNGKIYLWGGRGGKAMTPLNEDGRFWVFDGITWEQTPYPSGDIPEPRSYHSLAAIKDKIYLHAGCPASGRLASLHVYSISDNSWTTLPSAPGLPRGGTCFTAVNNVLLRFGGFSGEELGGSIDIFNPFSNIWTTRPFTRGPGNRSVAIFLPHPLYPDTHAVLLFGEKSPSNDGHNAAGQFWNDIWIYDYGNDLWEKATVENSHLLLQDGFGWTAGAVDLSQKTNQLIVWGGLNQYNDRISTSWIVRF